MTSTEFAAKYRLLKNVATRGARSFLAQQVELGRMVMVHYLDAENAGERAATVARLNALPSGSRGKLMEIAEVDGTPVAVTLFISSFKDFATWLDSVSPPASAPASAPAPAPVEAPAVVPAPKPEAPKRTPGEFTRIFGKVDESTVAPTTLPPIALGVTPTRNEDAIPTVIMEAVKPPHAAPPPKPEPPPAADSGSSFTAIFGSLGDSPHAPSDLPAPPPFAPPPLASSPAASAPSMPPAPPPLDFRPSSPSPAPQAPAPSQPGEFTQLFQRLSPSGGVQPPSPRAAPPSFFAPEVPRPIELAPRADAAPPAAPSLGAPSMGLPPLAAPALGAPTLGAPSLGMSSLGAPPLSAPKPPEPTPPRDGNGLPPMASLTPPPLAAPPRSWGTPATPPPIGASVFGNSGPSEFTRMLSPIAPPPPPPVSIQPPAAPAAAPAAGAGKKSMLPLIIALATVVVITIVIVGYFVMRGGKGG